MQTTIIRFQGPSPLVGFWGKAPGEVPQGAMGQSPARRPVPCKAVCPFPKQIMGRIWTPSLPACDAPAPPPPPPPPPQPARRTPDGRAGQQAIARRNALFGARISAAKEWFNRTFSVGSQPGFVFR